MLEEGSVYSLEYAADICLVIVEKFQNTVSVFMQWDLYID